MKADRRILLAAPPEVTRAVGPALSPHVELLTTATLDEAIGLLHTEKPDAIVVCYAFDDVRPFRLLHYLAQEWRGPDLPVILLRALPISLGQAEESQLREAYHALGVRAFVDFWSEAALVGREEALLRFRDSVLSHLPPD